MNFKGQLNWLIEAFAYALPILIVVGSIAIMFHKKMSFFTKLILVILTIVIGYTLFGIFYNNMRVV